MSRQEYDEDEGKDVTVGENDLLVRGFEAHRGHLQAVAFRMLGSRHEAEDALQEAWLRLSRADVGSIENLKGWLTTVVARICLDVLRTRVAKREVIPEAGPHPAPVATPEEEALLSDSVGSALLVVMDTLSPAERVAFVLHDMFAVPFEEIAPIVGRAPAAARQLASRARRRVQADPVVSQGEHSAAEREVVAAFFAASRAGDFAGLLRLLDPDVVLRADPLAVETAARRADVGAPALSQEMRGQDAVAGVFGGGARAARPVLVDGQPGAVVRVGGRPIAIFVFIVRDGRVIGIELLAEPETLAIVELMPA